MSSRETDRRLTPRFNLPEVDRVRIALVLYADLFRSHDIAAACKLPNRRLAREVALAGLPRRRNREASLPIRRCVNAIHQGKSAADLERDFGIRAESARAIVLLAVDGVPIAAHLTRPTTPRERRQPPDPMRRCGNCRGLARSLTNCPFCGAPW